MAFSTFAPGEVLTAASLNAKFNDLYNMITGGNMGVYEEEYTAKLKFTYNVREVENGFILNIDSKTYIYKTRAQVIAAITKHLKAAQ